MDAQARFRDMFRATYGVVRRYAHHRGLSGGDADDLVADVFLVAWRRFDEVPGDDPVPWLLAVARNHWRNDLRRRRRRADLIHRLEPPGLAAVPGVPDDGEAGRIRTALATLSDSDQELLRLIAWDDLTAGQAAVVLGCSPGAVRVRLHRARTRLSVLLRTEETFAASETPTGRHPGTVEGPDARS